MSANRRYVSGLGRSRSSPQTPQRPYRQPTDDRPDSDVGAGEGGRERNVRYADRPDEQQHRSPQARSNGSRSGAERTRVGEGGSGDRPHEVLADRRRALSRAGAARGRPDRVGEEPRRTRRRLLRGLTHSVVLPGAAVASADPWAAVLAYLAEEATPRAVSHEGGRPVGRGPGGTSSRRKDAASSRVIEGISDEFQLSGGPLY